MTRHCPLRRSSSLASLAQLQALPQRLQSATRVRLAELCGAQYSLSAAASDAPRWPRGLRSLKTPCAETLGAGFLIRGQKKGVGVGPALGRLGPKKARGMRGNTNRGSVLYSSEEILIFRFSISQPQTLDVARSSTIPG